MEDASAVSEASVDQLTSWKFGRTRPDFFALQRLCDASGDSITWLATGAGHRDSSRDWSQGERTQQEQASGSMLQIVDPKALDDGALILVPRLDVEASAGAGMVVDEDDVSEMVAFDPRWLRARSITPQAARIITARGDSMEPTIRSGDLLVVDTAIETAVDSGVYVVSYAGALVVKRLFLLHTGAIILSSDNKVAGRDEEIPAHSLDQLRIAGRVMWYGRMM